jgi:hypothetical protein
MRPRFSVRWLLLAFAVLAAVCYLLFERPTVIAERFVAAVHQRDYATAQALLQRPHLWSGGESFALYVPRSREKSARTVLMYAEVLPREWSDIWRFQRRVIFRAALQDDSDGRHIEWSEDTQMVAHVGGLEVVGD